MATLLPILASELGPLATPAGVLFVLIALAAVILIGRLFLALAWRLVIIGIIVVGTLYVLGLLGFHFDVFA